MRLFKKGLILTASSVALILVGYLVGRHLQPAKVEVKKEQVIKEVEVIKKDVRIIERKVTSPDGTKTEERIIEDRSTETVKREEKNKESKVVIAKKPDWRFKAMGGFGSGGQTIYGIGVEKRLLGSISIGVWGLSNQSAGVSISIEF